VGSVLGGQTPRASPEATGQSNATACPAPPARDTARRTADDSASRVAGRATESVTAAPAIVLLASVTAREVRFASQPRIQVRLCGAVTDSVRVVERKNLPDPVQPGVTYRDVSIAVEIFGHLNADCLARRIGVAPRDTTRADVCAALSVRDTSTATRVTPRPPS
jgi:hypothetical protein